MHHSWVRHSRVAKVVGMAFPTGRQQLRAVFRTHVPDGHSTQPDPRAHYNGQLQRARALLVAAAAAAANATATTKVASAS